jgi:hypothetical protein
MMKLWTLCAAYCAGGGLPSTKEPGLTVLHQQATGPRPPTGKHRDLLFSLEGEQCVGDI